MNIHVEETSIKDVLLVMPELFSDERGFFSEIYRKDQYANMGLPSNFVQFNHSGSVKKTIRGLHFQWSPPMGKLMRVVKGRAFLVAVDIRLNSPTFGKWFGLDTSSKEIKMVWAPAGFARGFCVLSDYAEIQYFTTGIYNSQCESGILWNDPEIGIKWPVNEPIISRKDETAQTLSQWLSRNDAHHFKY